MGSNNFRVPKHDFGVSWGFPGFRVGRSQYGTWWISISLPLGFRINKRLGKLRDPDDTVVIPEQKSQSTTAPAPPISQTSNNPMTKNQEILDRIKNRS